MLCCGAAWQKPAVCLYPMCPVFSSRRPSPSLLVSSVSRPLLPSSSGTLTCIVLRSSPVALCFYPPLTTSPAGTPCLAVSACFSVGTWRYLTSLILCLSVSLSLSRPSSFYSLCIALGICVCLCVSTCMYLCVSLCSSVSQSKNLFFFLHVLFITLCAFLFHSLCLCL